MAQKTQKVDKALEAQWAKLKKEDTEPSPEVTQSPKNFYNEAFGIFEKIDEFGNKSTDIYIEHDFSDKELLDLESDNPKLDALSIVLNFFLSEKNDHPADPENLLSSIEDCLKLLTSFQVLGELLIPEFYQSSIEFCSKFKSNGEGNKTKLDLQFNLCKIYTLNAIKRGIEKVNVTAVNEGMSYEKYELVLNSLAPINYLIQPIPLDNLNSILEGIKRVFPEFIIPKFKSKKRVKPSNKAFKEKHIEPTPNHSTCIDILTLLIKSFQFTDNSNISEFNRVNHSNKKNKFDAYTELAIPKPENIEIGDKTFYIIKGFDWKDIKILRLIFTEALKHNGKFDISFRYVLEIIGELKNGGNTLKEKFEDLKKRFIKYRSTLIKWKYILGKKILGDHISGEDIFLLNFEKFYDVSRGNTLYDIGVANVNLGDYFEINRSLIKQFTRIPKELLLINTSHHWLSFAIAEKICVLLRTQKEHILKSRSAYGVPVKLKVKSLLDDVLTPEELKGALDDSRKGHKLKNKILGEIKYLELNLKWQFNWIGLTDNISFNDFYNNVSFETITDSELECAILGEKLITEVVTPKVKSNVTINDLIKALETHAHTRKVSIRKLTTLTLNKKHPWLQKRLDPKNDLFGKLTQKEIAVLRQKLCPNKP
ncbi:hypothetical protein [Geminocystis sp. NIES-3709]|uniref:hypothetical protein n=1 Tax=Geminocystis sp. NIES-3709 TaxID=1617448 RepID=UPI0005FC60DF|nr:hypothetical protein [Geminocystis sp. NIES-3709]BAQ64597.1 hypothetical protein GM3709_1362 [Geminocystis sp. NIES-3709]